MRIAGAAARAPQLVRGRDQIGDVGGKGGVGKLALARAEPGEVEAQHGDAERGQALGDALGGVDVLAAGKAVGEQRVGARLPSRADRAARRDFALRHWEIEAFSRHALLPSTAGASPRVSMSSSSLHLDLVVVHDSLVLRVVGERWDRGTRADRVGVPPPSSTRCGLAPRTGARWATLNSSSSPCFPPTHFPALARSSVRETARPISLTSPLTSPTLSYRSLARCRSLDASSSCAQVGCPFASSFDFLTSALASGDLQTLFQTTNLPTDSA